MVASGAERSALIALLSSQSAGIASYWDRTLLVNAVKLEYGGKLHCACAKKRTKEKRRCLRREAVLTLLPTTYTVRAGQSEGESILPVLDLRCKCEFASSSAEFFAFELFLTLAVLLTVFATAMFALMPNAAAYTLGDWVDIMYGRASFPGREWGLCGWRGVRRVLEHKHTVLGTVCLVSGVRLGSPLQREKRVTETDDHRPSGTGDRGQGSKRQKITESRNRVPRCCY